MFFFGYHFFTLHLFVFKSLSLFNKNNNNKILEREINLIFQKNNSSYFEKVEKKIK
jgi:hypothetical protein